jgi:hypothetical protein
MPNVITMGNNTVLTDQGRGAKHQLVVGPQTAAHPASYYAPVPVGAVLGSGTVGTAYSATITAQGGLAPYTFAITGGSLPTGLTMTSAGLISGTPSAAGTFNFTVTVTDANANSGSQGFTIVVNAPASGGGNFGFVA